MPKRMDYEPTGDAAIAQFDIYPERPAILIAVRVMVPAHGASQRGRIQIWTPRGSYSSVVPLLVAEQPQWGLIARFFSPKVPAHESHVLGHFYLDRLISGSWLNEITGNSASVSIEYELSRPRLSRPCGGISYM